MLEYFVIDFLLDQTSRGNSQSTLIYYRSCLDSFLKFTGDDFEVKNLTPRLLKSYVVHLSHSGISSISVQSYVRGLRAFLRWLFDEEIIEDDLCAKFRLPKASRKVIDVLSDQDIDRLLSTLSGSDWLQVRNRLIVLLMVDCGLRLNEVVELRRKDVNLDSRSLIVTGKGDKQRFVPFGHSTAATLRHYLQVISSAGSQEFLIIKDSETRCGFEQITHSTIKNMFRRLRVRSGIDRLYPHLLRHTFATRYLENGGNMYSLQAILGHSSLEMVKKYVHIAACRIQADFPRFSPVDNIKKEPSEEGSPMVLPRELESRTL